LRATGKEEVGLVVVQFACERRRYLPFETSPPGPLSTKWRGGKKKARLFAGVPPLQLRWRGGQGVRFRRADTFDVHRQTEPLPGAGQDARARSHERVLARALQ